MERCKYVLLIILCPLLLFGQKVEVDGELIADSLDVQSGLIKNLADPVSAQDAATMAYVDNKLLTFGISIGPIGIQGLLSMGISPSVLISNGASLTDFIGLNYGGGIIFYMDPSGNGTGLTAASTDQSSAAPWCIGNFITGADGTAIGTGNQNTILIEAVCTDAGLAADVCANLSLNGFTDWYLPSLDELNEMYTKIGGGAPAPNTNIGNFGNQFYWSSSELDAIESWAQRLDVDGTQSSGSKVAAILVRAIRSF